MANLYQRFSKQVRFKLHLPAFRSRNFRLYFLGQTFSLSGTFMTQVAVPWLIYDLTHSPWLLGLAGFLGFLPTLILLPLAGVLSDRWSRHYILTIVQLLGMVVSGTLTALVFTGMANFQSLLLLSVLLGMVKGLDMPIRHAFVSEMVTEREDLANAIALNSIMLSSSRLFGPALGGILLATVGAGFCFLFDTLSYLAAIWALASMRLNRPAISKSKVSAWKSLKEGFNYVQNFLPVRMIILLLAIQGVFGISYTALLPVFAADILRGGASSLGFLSASGAVGSVLACVYLSQRRGIAGLERTIGLCPAVIGIGLIAFSVSRSFLLSLVILVFVGAAGTLQVACSNTVVQSIVEDSKRGRVMSIYAMSLVGMMPFSNLIGGTLAHYLGAPQALMVCAIVCFLGSIWYGQKLPDLTRSIQMVTASRQSVNL
ncbi:MULTISPECIES: MFS transporter [Leptolyngbya]|uniref:MFS transporter n=1 Tax=Leptolyngbya TaxID=47251 RepID=UPI0016891102|nr:MFS transporter [Leptolyngbya sp. FACHB-1624]MBD1855071.1 MFS transporter [Leptolyngbya sp. FACHB-1624]